MPSTSLTVGTPRLRWIHLHCPSCQEAFRVRPSMLAAGVDCPFCDVAYADTGQVSAEHSDAIVLSKPKKADKKSKPPSLANLQTKEPPPKREAPSWATPPGPQLSAAEKVKIRTTPAPKPLPQHAVDPHPKTAPQKKRRPERATHTTTSPSDVTEYLERDPNDETRVRLKRTERRRQAGRTQKILQRSLQVAAGLAVVMIGILIASSVLTAGKIVSQDPSNLEAPAVNPQKSVELESVAKTFLKPGESKDAAETVRACFRSVTIEEKLQFVRNPEKVRPLMEEWYERFPLQSAELGKVLRQKKIEVSEGQHIIMLAMEVPGSGYEFFAVEKLEDNTYKVDWPVSSAYQKMPLEEFKNKMPITKVPFRLKGKLSNYYNYTFSDPEIYQCIELYYPGNDSFRLYGYINRSSKSTSDLISRLEFGPMSLVLNLRYPPNSKQNDQVEISDLIATDWFSN